PIEPLLLSPPMPRMMAPSLCIGEYPDGEVGSAPEYRVASPPDWALPSLSAKKLVPLFFSIAVTNGARLPVLDVLVLCPTLDWNRPFSRSACTQGPLPLQGLNQHSVPKLMASMCPLPLSRLFVSALP